MKYVKALWRAIFGPYADLIWAAYLAWCLFDYVKSRTLIATINDQVSYSFNASAWGMALVVLYIAVILILLHAGTRHLLRGRA